jgi:hypothetical protein
MARELTVRRKPYHRKGYTRKDGTYVKPSHVPASTFKVKDRGLPGRGKAVIKHMKAGALSKYGYSTKKPEAARHLALGKAIKASSSGKVFQRLHAQVILRQNAKPDSKEEKTRKKFEADRAWVSSTYGGPTPRAAIKKWKSMSHAARVRARAG